MQYLLLGPVDVQRDGESLDLGVYKQRALLALLLINANTVVSTDRIIDELWGEPEGRDRQNALWTVVSRLRSVLEPDRKKRTDGTILLTQPPGYLLAVDPGDVDATRFELLAGEGRSLLETDPQAASLVLSEALALWRGHALEEFTYESFATTEIERLEELRLAAVEDRIDADLRAGHSRQLVGELESLVRQHPFRQRLVGHLMLALHRSGRQGDALRAFGALRTRLAEELGLDASDALSQLEERIVLDDPSLGDSQAPRALTGRAESGLSIRGYELRDKIGEGSTGHVYRAFQPAVGREVAIKVINPEYANDPEFIRRFEAEAQLIASLEHPQIVPVFDYWREPDSAFLVMRRFDHGNLRDALHAGPLSTAAAVKTLSQVGGALATAHRRGVVHGDVRPENVLFDRDSNAYLTDFGMSLDARAPSGADRNTSPDRFVAPEHAAGGTATERSDIYSFGALAEYALRGATGDSDTPESPMVGPAAAIIGRAMADDPHDRFPDVGSFLDAMANAFEEPPLDGRSDDVEISNPYRGLRAFSERDADQFFGRERLVERLVARLGHAGPRGGFVALVGPSGSGKSSVIRAGLVPALRNGAITGSDRWFIVSMTPGRHPFEALDDALRSIAVQPPANLLELLTTSGISAAVESLTADRSAQTVIVVDQLEELFSQASTADANAFMDALADTAMDRHSVVKVVATLRADFYDHPLRHGAFGELLRLGTEVITPMSAQELDRAITAPAAEVGLTFEPGLVATIEADMAGQPTALPLMQYALTELFEQRRGRTLAVDAYRELGGVSGALARRAAALYDGLGREERAAVRDVFLRLVSIDDASADTRRRALVSELTDVVRDDVSGVLEAFGRHRLLSFDRDPITRGPTVEIAHEALLTEWTRLRHWIDDARSDIQAQRRLALAAAEWSDRDRQTDFLLTGARLSRYDGWLERPPVQLTTREREYLAASRNASDTDLRIERARVQRLRRLIAGVGVALVAALVAGSIAFVQRQRAADAVQDAELAILISQAAAARADDPELAVLLALEAHERSPGFDTEQAILSALNTATLDARIASWEPLPDDCIGVGQIPEGFPAAAELATVDGRMVARDLATGQMVDAGPPPGACAIGFRTDTDGTAVRMPDASKIWMGPNWETEVSFDRPTFPILETVNRLAVAEFADVGGTVRILDRSSGEPVGDAHTGGFLRAQVVDAERDLMAVAFGESNTEEDGSLVVIDAATGTEVMRLVVPQTPTAVAFDPATGDLVVALRGGNVVAVDPQTGDTVREIATDQVVGYNAVGFRRDGQLILVSRDSITLLDREVEQARVVVELQNVAQALIRPDGLIVTVTERGQRNVYDLDRSALVERAWEADGFSAVAALDGKATIVNRPGDDLGIVDLATGEREDVGLRLPDGTPFIPRVMYAEPDGVWAMSEDLVLGRWEGNEMVDMLDVGSEPGLGWFPYGNHPSGTRFGDRYAVIGAWPSATSDSPGQATEAILVDLTRGDPAVVFRVDVEGFWAHPTIGGGMVVADRSGALHTYDATGRLLGDVIETGADPYAMTMSADGTTLAMGSLGAAAGFEDGAIFVLDVPSGDVHAVPVEGLVSTIGVTDDGSRVVLAMFDGTVRLYDVEERNVPTIIYNGTGAFTSQPGWHDAASGTMWIHSDGKLLELLVSSERWVERACDIASRQLTEEEWDRLVPGDEPLRSICM